MDEPPSLHSVQIHNETELPVQTGLLKKAVVTCLEIAKADPSWVTVLVTSDHHVASLNSRFRGVSEATDVLTFPDEFGTCGDVAIAGPFAQRQSVARGVPFEHEVALLAIHGTLHLLGLNDELETDRLYMIERMYQVASRIGLPTSDDWGSLLHDLERL